MNDRIRRFFSVITPRKIQPIDVRVNSLESSLTHAEAHIEHLEHRLAILENRFARDKHLSHSSSRRI